MVLKAEQERLQTLLREAIPMMCKNGVPYKTEFSIEALIGITVDQNEVFLVSIKETFQNEAAIKELEKAKEAELAKEAERQKELEAASRQSETGSPRSPRSPRARKRRRSRESIGKSSSADRTPSRDINESDYEEEDTKEKLKFATDLSFGDDSNSYMEDGANQNPNDSAYNEYEPPPKSRPYVDSKERLQQDDEEIVIIKEEPADALSDISFPPSAQGQFSNASQMPSQPQFSHSFGSLSQHNQSGQLPPPQMQQSPLQGQQGPNPSERPIPPERLNSSERPNPSDGPNPNEYIEVRISAEDNHCRSYVCKICQRAHRRPSEAIRHVKSLHFKSQVFVCRYCGKKLNWKSNFLVHERKCMDHFLNRQMYADSLQQKQAENKQA